MTEPVEEAPKVKQVTVLDRTFEVMEPSPIQFAIIGRSYRRLQRINANIPANGAYSEGQLNTALDTIAQYLDVISGLVVDPDVADWLEEMMTKGKLRQFKDMEPLFTAFTDTDQAKPNRAARRAKQ